jgi:hypothetical protein
VNKVADEVDSFLGGGYLREALQGKPGLSDEALDWIMEAVELRLHRCQPRRTRGGR